MGGRTAKSGMNTEKKIDKSAFKSEGNGQWSIDIEGIGGGSILDETGSMRDPMAGRGGKVYSITTWDNNYQITEDHKLLSGSLNSAKQAVKDKLKSMHK